MKAKQKNYSPRIMGILNVTPDSFSDGGQYNAPDKAIKRAFEMRDQGADIIDIGGESTRPGAEEVSTEEQIKRVIPVIKGLRKAEGIYKKERKLLISVDTSLQEVAKAALDAGANWINDISAGEDSTDTMMALAAENDAHIVLMHRKGKSDRMQDNPGYEDVVAEVNSYLQERAEFALKAGVKRQHIILDPGIGFGKLLEHNLALLAALPELVAFGFPVLLGTSRKRFLGEITAEDDPEKRVAATCATTALGVAAGVRIFRVHDVLENRQAADVAWEILQHEK